MSWRNLLCILPWLNYCLGWVSRVFYLLQRIYLCSSNSSNLARHCWEQALSSKASSLGFRIAPPWAYRSIRFRWHSILAGFNSRVDSHRNTRNILAHRCECLSRCGIYLRSRCSWRHCWLFWRFSLFWRVKSVLSDFLWDYSVITVAITTAVIAVVVGFASLCWI